MAITRGGQIMLSEYKNWGGSSYDSRHYADAFRHDRPYDFGVQVSKMFSASNRFNDKVLTSLTMASGNFKEIPNDVFRWTLAGDDEVPFYITELLEGSNPRPGYGKATFRIALNHGFLQEPDVLQFEDNRLPLLEIVGTGQQVGNSTYYTVQLQTSDPNEWVPVSELAVGKRLIKASTSISTEMNDKWGTDAYGSMLDLEAQIGAFGEMFEVTDKVIRKEIQAKASQGKKDVFSTGYAFDVRQGDKIIPRGAFITMAEARLLNRVEMDREMSMVFGTSSTRTDSTGRYTRRTGAGYRQLVKDGHILYHNGGLNAAQLESYFHGIFLQRRDGEDRHIVISTGEAGMRLLHQIVSDEYNSFLTVDSSFLSKVPGIGGNRGLSYGAQFMEFQAINGIRITWMHNPMLDNHKYCGRVHPEDPRFTVDSYRMDIFDFGTADGGAESNMSMVVESGVESYAYTCGIYDPYTGAEKSGGKVASFEKGVKFEREISGGLLVWDTSRIGSIIFEPEA